MSKVEYQHQEQERRLLAEQLESRFIVRRDVNARQLDDGRWTCIRQPFHTGLMLRHLKGEITLGGYLLDQHSQAGFIVLDADTDTQFEQLKQAAEVLEHQGVTGYLETSRRGGHMWLFFSQALSGQIARSFGRGLAQAFGLDGIEVFPKQDRLGEGPGSLIRLPFGIHRKTGLRYEFVYPDGTRLGTPRQQIEQLCHPQTVPPEAIKHYQYRQPEKPVQPAYTSPQVESLKDIPLMDFIGQYVQLRPVASGGIGKCPFHEDTVPSFGVNRKGNFWSCFAGCGGGDIISFWQKWKGISFKDAVSELESEVLHGNHIHRD